MAEDPRLSQHRRRHECEARDREQRQREQQPERDLGCPAAWSLFRNIGTE
jgi:hypothetical protein